MCSYSQSDHALPHWKCVLWCCAKFPSINITDQETYDKHPNPSNSIRFHIYHLIARCTKHGRLPLTNKKSCRKCQQDTASVQSTKIYTRKKLLMMETTISNFHTNFYIPEIQTVGKGLFFLGSSETESCLNLRHIFLSFNVSLPCVVQREIR